MILNVLVILAVALLILLFVLFIEDCREATVRKSYELDYLESIELHKTHYKLNRELNNKYMKNFQKNDRVKIISGTQADERYVNRCGIILEDSPFPFVALDGGDFYIMLNERELEKVEPSIDSLCVGDVVEDVRCNDKKVLGVAGAVFFLSSYLDLEQSGESYTKEDLKNLNFTLKDAPETETREDKAQGIMKDIGKNFEELKEALDEMGL